MQALVFLLFVGNVPMMLNVAVVNYDSGYLGARLAYLVNTTDLLETHFYNTTAAALATVTQPGGALAVFVIPANFTAALAQLMSDPARFAANFSNVQLHLDYGDYQVRSAKGPSSCPSPNTESCSLQVTPSRVLCVAQS